MGSLRLCYYALLAFAAVNAQPQRGPPPPPPPPPGYSYYRPQIPHPQLQVQHHQPHHLPSPLRPLKPGATGPSKLMGWLNSQMAKLPSLTAGRHRSPFPYQKYKQQISSPSPYGGKHSSVPFSSPPPPRSPYLSGGGAAINSIVAGNDISHIFYPQQSPAGSVMTPQNTVFQVISPDGSSRYVPGSSPPPGYENFFGEQGVVQQTIVSSQPPPPPPATSIYGLQQQQQQIQQPAQVVYHYQNAPGGGPLYAQKSAGNIEVLPSKMVSYEKETISTGHPQYQQAVEGMTTAASNGYPIFYQQQQTQATPTATEYRGQQVPNVGSNLNSLFHGVAPNIAPIYDLSGSSSTIQQQTVATPPQEDHMQADYSQQSSVAVVPPPQNYVPPSQPQQGDLQVAESNYNPGSVQILNHGAHDGNPTFEVIADANAPTYEGGAPFDLSQLVSMIEPGAQLSDIVAEGQAEGTTPQ